ncbi:sensor histidine kinase [bacterium]|nr:sensor histidine kinase [bacterium]
MLRALGSPSVHEVRSAVTQLGDSLRDRLVDAERLFDIERALLSLAGHASWEVREALARCARHMNDATVPELLARLQADENARVQKAAALSASRRVASPRADVLSDEYEAIWHRRVEAFRERYGSRAANDMRSIAEEHNELAIKSLCHELTKDLAVIDAGLRNHSLDWQAQDASPERGLERMAKLRRSVDHASRVLEAVRSLATRLEPTFAKEDLRDVVADAEGQVRANGGEKLELEAAFGEIVLGADRGLLAHAFSNFLKNAVEAYDGTAAPARVRVGATVEAGSRVIVTFEDAGRGMNAEALADAFHLFASRKPGGLGFGLPFARQVIESHQGTVRLSSEPGRGTTVTVVLPLEQERTRT